MTSRSRLNRSCWKLLLFTLLAQAQSACDSPSSSSVAPLEPRKFKFDLPPAHTRLWLRGEGSEQLLAPPGARVDKKGEQFLVNASKSFQLVVRTTSDPLNNIERRLNLFKTVLRADDTLIVQNESGFAFVVVRELVPEWDESDRRRLSCSSAGLLEGHAPFTTYAQKEIEAMVATCRSLALPSLD